MRIIATSREPLRAEGEWVYAVPPLAVPAADAQDDEDLLRYGAVRLFTERARAVEPHFVPDRRLTTVIAAICRRLDGIPLAIELAAARTSALGIEALAARLDDRFQLLTGGRRPALPRQQTLRATLDWSYGLLADPERVLLRRLAIFAGPFSLDAVIASEFGWEALEGDGQEAGHLAKPKDGSNILDFRAHYPQFRQYTPKFLETFQFEAIPAQKPLLKALEVLRQMNRDERTEVPAESIRFQGVQAAFSVCCSSVCGRKPGYQRRNVCSHSSLSTRVRICSSRCAPRWLHCICWCLTIRLLTT